MQVDVEDDAMVARPPFATWLLQRKDRGGLIGQLANGAVADRRFPESGDAEAVRKHLSLMQADGDLFDAVDDAEVDWLAYRRRWLNRPADA